MCRINKIVIVLSLIISSVNIICNAQGFPPSRGPAGKMGSGRETGKEGKAVLPMPTADVPSSFDRALMDAKKDSPFGFFDPNMLRFKHTSWYEDYTRIMNDIGAYWASFGATFNFSWNLIQGKNLDGSYNEPNWGRHDGLVKHAQACNIHIIGMIRASEPVAEGQGRKVTPSLPEDIEGYNRFVKEVVERYDGDGEKDMPGLQYPVKYWSIEDEPMSPKYFNGTGGDYAVLLSAAYEAIKSADSNANVICSMVRETGLMANVQPGVFMEDFFKKLAQMGKNRPYDIMDQHWIGGQDSFSRYSFYKELMEDIDRTTRKYGFTPAPFVALEVAGSFTTEEVQAVDLFRRYVILLSLGVKRILWSGLKAAPEQGLNQEQKKNYFREVTLIKENDEKKMAYYTYKLMVETLDGADWDRTQVLQAKDGLFIFKFVKNDIPIWVVWSDKGESAVRITAGEGVKKAEVIETVPKGEPDKDVKEYLNIFRREECFVKEGVLEIKVDETPLIIMGK